MSILRALGYITGRNRLDKLFGKGLNMGNNQHKRISSAVTEFVNNHIDQEFTARELRAFVLGRVPNSAPASSDRIMRQLRQEGKINYVLVSRTKSLYKGLPKGSNSGSICGSDRGR